MKILLFDNSAFTEISGKLYCVSGTGGFAKELVEAGNEVTMFGQRVVNPTSISYFEIEANGIKTISYCRRNNKFFNYILLYWNAILSSFKFDFVYVFYPTSYKYFLLLCIIFRRKYGLYIRGVEGTDDRISRFIYKHTTVVFTVAQYFTDIANGCKKGVAHTIRPMISYTHNDIVRNREYPVDVKKYEMLFLCRIEKDKGIDELLYALKSLIDKKVTNFHLRVVGSGDYLFISKALANELKINDFVSFEGAVNDEAKKQEYYRTSDIYVLPTYYKEGFPRTLYEAMIFGTPIVTTFVAGIPSLMIDKVNCYKIEERSVESIVSGLEYAFNNYKEMSQYAKSATELVSKVIDPNRLSHAMDLHTFLKSNL